MSQPMDPDNFDCDGPTEYSWGPGLFPPGIANNEGQRYQQVDFGKHMVPSTEGVGSSNDNYARAVADRRTDPTNPDSNRSFETYGNPDRFGKNPSLVQAPPQPDISQNPDRRARLIPRLRREK